MDLSIFIAIYLFCSIAGVIYTFGTTFAYFNVTCGPQNKRTNYGTAVLMSCFVAFCPPVVLGIICLSDFNENGWKIK